MRAIAIATLRERVVARIEELLESEEFETARQAAYVIADALENTDLVDDAQWLSALRILRQQPPAPDPRLQVGDDHE